MRSSVPDPDPHVFGLPDPDPDPLVRGMDPDTVKMGNIEQVFNFTVK